MTAIVEINLEKVFVENMDKLYSSVEALLEEENVQLFTKVKQICLLLKLQSLSRLKIYLNFLALQIFYIVYSRQGL